MSTQHGAENSLGLYRKSSVIRGPNSPPLIDWTFNDILRSNCGTNPAGTAVISQQQNRTLTYHQLDDRSSRLAHGLYKLGVRRGSRVAVMLGNRLEYVEILFACSRLGAYFTLLNYAYSANEFKLAIERTTPSVLFATTKTSKYDYTEMLAGALSPQSSVRHVVLCQGIDVICPSITANGYVAYDEVFDESADSHLPAASDVKPSDIFNLQFTSGSTGLPKAAALTHYGVINCARYIAMQMSVHGQDKVVIPVPLFHAFGLIIGVAVTLVSGATTVLPCEYFDAGATLSAVEGYSCTGLYGVTTMFIDMLSHQGFASTQRSSLRFGLMAGSSMPEELLNRVIETFPIRDLYTNWGMTELSSIATMTTAADPIQKKMRTAGRLLPNLVAKIVDPTTAQTLPWGQRGEIVVSGFSVMESYFQDSERTAQAIKQHEENGLPGFAVYDERHQRRQWMHTGDEGYLDGEGYFVITGRIKDLIIRGGENISPLEIESRLYEHPAVKQVSVFGVPSARYGEEVAAMLEHNDAEGKRPSDVELKSWVQQLLARYKVPVHIWWLGDKSCGLPQEWPKTANGKLKKDAIKAMGEGKPSPVTRV